MNKITTLGIDLAKNSFQLHGVSATGKVLLKKKVSRSQLTSTIANMPPCLIGMEACSGSNYWSRIFVKFGHTVKMISPRFVKPYVKSNKNDAADAEAICEAVSRPSMRFVPTKSLVQQDIQTMHRIRSRLIKEKVALMNSARGLLIEYGITAPQGVSHLKKLLNELIGNEADNTDNEYEITSTVKFICEEYYDSLRIYEEKIQKCEDRIDEIFKSNPICKNIESIPGVGRITSTIIFASIGNASEFPNGRAFAAYLGLVPKQSSTGGKDRLLGISKRGDKYIRSLLIHGARSVLISSPLTSTDKKTQWVKDIKERKCMNKAAVAIANRNARIIWALVKNNTEYMGNK